MPRLYSTEKILMYVGNDKDQCHEMVDLFLDTIPPEIENLSKAVFSKDWNLAYEISHRIKPSIEIMQIENSWELFSEFDTKLSQRIDLDNINDLYMEILKGLKLAISQIKEDFK